jgi:hypothetical protein
MATFFPMLFGHAIIDCEPGRRRSEPMPTADLRVPAELKQNIEVAAARAGLPADLWLVEKLGRSLGSARV